MEHVLYPQPGYPFSLTLSIEYALSDTGAYARTRVPTGAALIRT
jgi:hypothetical protein